MMNTESQDANRKSTIPSRPKDECGLFGVYGHEDAAKLTYFGLYALQHRGQESADTTIPALSCPRC